MSNSHALFADGELSTSDSLRMPTRLSSLSTTGAPETFFRDMRAVASHRVASLLILITAGVMTSITWSCGHSATALKEKDQDANGAVSVEWTGPALEAYVQRPYFSPHTGP